MTIKFTFDVQLSKEEIEDCKANPKSYVPLLEDLHNQVAESLATLNATIDYIND